MHERSYQSINSKKKPMKVKKGTYYIKVVRGTGSVNKKSSGAYALSWTMG